MRSQLALPTAQVKRTISYSVPGRVIFNPCLACVTPHQRRERIEFGPRAFKAIPEYFSLPWRPDHLL